MQVETVGIGLAGALFLYVFYSAIRNQWPESYVTMVDAVENFVSTSLLRYVAFRIVPVYVTVVFATVSADRVGAWPRGVAFVIAAVHIGFTNFRATVGLVRRRERSSAWINLVAFNVLTCLILIATASFALWTRSAWASLIPTRQDTISALWTGVLAAVLAVFFRNLVVAQRSEEELFDQAREDLGDDLWTYASRQSSLHSCDVGLIRSILLAEVIQRPRWTRRIERWKGKVIPSGTYGAAQMSSRKPITDQESIDLLCQRFANYRVPRHHEGGYVLDERLKARVEQHNPNAVFVNQVISFYRLTGDYRDGTEDMAGDGRPIIEVKDSHRRGKSWQISGTAVVFEGNVTYSAYSRGREVSRGSIQTDLGAPGRGEWSLSLPLSVDAVVFSEEPMDEDAGLGSDRRTVRVEME